MSKGRWLTPKQIQKEIPNVYNLFWGDQKPKPHKSEYTNGLEYARAMQDWLKQRTMTA